MWFRGSVNAIQDKPKPILDNRWFHIQIIFCFYSLMYSFKQVAFKWYWLNINRTLCANGWPCHYNKPIKISLDKKILASNCDIMSIILVMHGRKGSVSVGRYIPTTLLTQYWRTFYLMKLAKVGVFRQSRARCKQLSNGSTPPWLAQCVDECVVLFRWCQSVVGNES